MDKIKLDTANPVVETLLVPLYDRAKETKRPDALIHDEHAVALVDRIDFGSVNTRLLAHDQLGVVLRVREFDRQTREFLARHPDAVVVHIGCGLDTRFSRVDNGQVEWYDLDMPEVIEIRQKLIAPVPRCHMIASSVFDTTWMDAVSAHAPRPFLFIAEAVLIYFEEAQVKQLMLTLLQRFAGAEFITDAMTPFAVWSHNYELRYMKLAARLRWSLRRPTDPEQWADGIRLVKSFNYFDTPEPRWGTAGLMRYIPFLANSVTIVHYQLGVT